MSYEVNLLKGLLLVFSALIGSVSTFTFKITHHKLCSLISLSAGALFGAAAFAIIPDTFQNLSLTEFILGLFSGYLVFWLISKYYFHVCPACSASHFDEQTTKKFSEIVLLMMTALAFHSFFDGLALTARTAHSHIEGNSIFIAILVHKFPEGLALASLMLGAAYEKKKIVINVFLVEMTTLVGAAAGILTQGFNLPESILEIIMTHIAGGFIFLSLHAILGEMLKHHTKLVVLYYLSGVILILAATLISNYF